MEKHLGVPKLPSGTGEVTSNAAIAMVHEWGIESQVQAMCFDSIASNTGKKNGACGKIETRLGRNLLYLADTTFTNLWWEICLNTVLVYCWDLKLAYLSVFRTFGQELTGASSIRR